MYIGIWIIEELKIPIYYFSSFFCLQSLRFYFSTALCMAADVLELIFSQTFRELAEARKSIEMGNEPIFNVIPVISSGRSAAMDDLITCELFASKM